MFGEEETRWLVVGICLSKVLTPVLREVIKEEIPKLYEKLIQPPTSIHLLTFASHLRSLPPSTHCLNYININNNETRGPPRNYDYRVKDDVSFAKLYVKPCMASFTAFDESLDTSAALSILCGTPVFVSMELISLQQKCALKFEMNGVTVSLPHGLKFTIITVFN